MKQIVAISHVLAVVVLCGGIVACPMVSKPPPEELTVPVGAAANVELSLLTMLLALTDPESLVAPPISLLPPETAEQAPLTEGCPMESMGDVTDSDGDNFPAAETRAFDCELFMLVGLAFGGSGSIVIADKDDMDEFSGVTLEADSAYRLSAMDRPLFSVTADVSLDVSPSAGAADYELSYQGTAAIADPFSRTDLAGGYDAMLTGTFAGGTLGVRGDFTVSTTLTDCDTLDDSALEAECRQAVEEIVSGSIILQVSASGLIYDAAACATTFTGGYFDVTDGSGNVLKSSYDGCSPATVTLNGQPVPPLES